MYKAQTLHAYLVKNGVFFNVYQCNLLLQSYINSGALFDAHKLLQCLPHTNVVSFNTILSGFFKSHLVSQALEIFNSSSQKDCHSWNIAISGCVKNQRLDLALALFVRMRRSFLRPDDFTYSIVIPCCDLGFGDQVHADVVKICSNSDAFLGTNLLRMYADNGDIKAAGKMFDEMTIRDSVMWNALISCYSKCGMGNASVDLFCRMSREGVVADEYTYAIILNELVSRLQFFEATQVHSLIVRRGLFSDSFISKSLLNLYAKYGFIDSAFLLFQEMRYQDVVSWTVIISGFSQSGHLKDALWLFHKMRLMLVTPNSYTLSGLVSACASSGAFQRGKQLHGFVSKINMENDIVVGSAIVDMYSKCGELGDALKLFRSIPERDIASWNAIIGGFAQNGEATEALNLYDELVLFNPIIVPNDITFVGVLSACSHAGLVKEGYKYFNDMILNHKVTPKTEHFTCMVDLLARSGLLEEAEAFMLALPVKPDIVMRTALLGACKLHGNLFMARRIAQKAEALDSSNYVLLSNSYVAFGSWCEALEVRGMMEARGVQKISGRSWIEIGDCMNSFLAGDKLHARIDTVYEILHRLYLQIEDRYEYDLNFLLNYPM